MYSDNDYRLYLEHSAKGSQRKDHKYISREWKGNGWQYTYPEDVKRGNRKPNLSARNRQNAESNRLSSIGIQGALDKSENDLWRSVSAAANSTKEYVQYLKDVIKKGSKELMNNPNDKDTIRALNSLQKDLKKAEQEVKDEERRYSNKNARDKYKIQKNAYAAGKARDEAARAAGINLASNVRMSNNEKITSKNEDRLKRLSKLASQSGENVRTYKQLKEIWKESISFNKKKLSELGREYTNTPPKTEKWYTLKGKIADLNKDIKLWEKQLKRFEEQISKSSENSKYSTKELSEMGRYADMKKRSSKK